METSNRNRHVLAACLAFALVSSTAHAQIYKWVDGNGQTHYSDRKEEAGASKVVEVKQAPQSTSPQSAGNSAEYWQEQERQFRERQLAKKTSEATPVAKRNPKSLSQGKVDDGSDIARCNLAKDVLSGAVRHRNGAPTDAYDRQVAENDVRAFCHQ